MNKSNPSSGSATFVEDSKRASSVPSSSSPSAIPGSATAKPLKEEHWHLQEHYLTPACLLNCAKWSADVYINDSTSLKLVSFLTSFSPSVNENGAKLTIVSESGSSQKST